MAAGVVSQDERPPSYTQKSNEHGKWIHIRTLECLFNWLSPFLSYFTSNLHYQGEIISYSALFLLPNLVPLVSLHSGSVLPFMTRNLFEGTGQP